jgi:hypothetical protein
MKVALILGQSDYQSVNKLPSCKNDLLYFAKIIEGTKNFDRHLIIDDSTMTASAAKDKIIQFIESCKSEQVDELLLYFTGHGDFDGKEFYYIWSDYTPSRKRQTSLQNLEIDTLLRQLDPKLVIKIIDACNSGISYIKDSEVIEKYLSSSEQSFKKCYFLFSSQNDQYSLADINMSYFTNTFLQSLNQDLGKKIRYKDIIDYISDSFEQSGKQTPFFVTQADFTDVFCSVNDEIKKILQNIKSVGLGDAALGLPAKQSLLDLVKQDAKRYVNFEAVLESLDIISKAFKNIKLIPELSDCYTHKTTMLDAYDSLPKIDNIANWLTKDKSGIYADVNYITEVYKERVPKNSFTSLRLTTLYSRQYNDEDYKTIEGTRKVAKSFTLKVDLPYKAIELTFYAQIPNLSNYSFVLLPLISRTQIVLFHAKLNYIRTSWDEQKIDIDSAKWSYSTFEYVVEDIEKGVNLIIADKFQNAIKEDLLQRFMPPDEVSEKEGEREKEKLP